MNKNLLEILVSPISKTPLIYRKEKEELWSKIDKLAFPIREGIPVMLIEEARPLTEEELDGKTHG
ncbi:MAG: Trm112 family protein [Gammaproteobacteria bacterium]|nr:Trm112 family protein [Gammaproteobacteria bacterium]